MPFSEKGDLLAISLDKDVKIKNRWRWDWLEEKTEKGTPHGTWCKKLATAGACYCTTCNCYIKYGSIGKMRLKDHGNDDSHIGRTENLMQKLLYKKVQRMKKKLIITLKRKHRTEKIEREVIGDVPDRPRVPQESDSESSDENADDDEQATPDPYVAETEIDTEDDEPIDDEQDFMTTWSKNLRGFPQIPPFTGASGIKVDLGDNPTAYDVYKQFLTDGIITHIKVETNR
ncbi:hypothetical protein BaRGS_00016385 [Batillaria attramentaria]|uniref:BED-type domain-containing protein n=1 Tax=Batillaria attramentaria TaxID=370345 RepID=A0ABD0KZD9_9CAEN